MYIIIFSILMSSLLLSLGQTVPVMRQLLPDYRDSTSQTSRTIDLSQFFGTAEVLPELVRLTYEFEDAANTLQQRNLDFLLFAEETPLTRDNFLGYVERGDYLGSAIHRSAPQFVIQGGGFGITSLATGLASTTVVTQGEVLNEFGIVNNQGTISMAKLGGDPDSATSQWFVSLAPNQDNLDFQNAGFTVFGRITRATFPNAQLLDPLTNGGEFRVTNVGGAFASAPIHFTAFDDPPTLTEGDFPIFREVVRAPIPAGEVGTGLPLTYEVTSLASSRSFASAEIVGSQLILSYNDAQVGDNVELTISGTDEVGTVIQDTMVVTMTDAQTFADWQRDNFSSAELADPNVSGPDADPEGDGSSNLEVFVQEGERGDLIAKNIYQLDENAVPAGTFTGRLSFPFGDDIAGVRFTLEVSEDLVSWRRVGFNNLTPANSSSDPVPIVTVELPRNPVSRSRGFYRVLFHLD